MKRIITILFILILTSTTAYAHPWLESIEIVKKTDCSGVIKEGVCCWDTDNDILYGGTGTAAQVIGGVGSTGDVVGPASSTDNAFSRFDSTTGKLLQNSGVICDDSNGVTIGSNAAGGNLTVKATEGTELAPTMSGASGVNWTYNANWVIAAGVNTHSAGSTGTLTPTVSLAPTAGTNYKISFTISGYSAGSVTMTFGGVLGTIRDANGTYTSYVIAATTGNLTFTPTTDFVGGISAVSVKVVTNGTLNVEGVNTFASRAILESGSAYAPALVFGTDTNKLGLYRYGGTTIGMSDSGNVRHTFNNADHWITSDTSTLRMGVAADVVLARAAANHLTLRNSTNPQTFSLYDTYTDASNYESYSLDAGVTTANTLTIKANTAGTGADNLNIAITPAGTGAIVVPAGLVATPAIVSDDADSGFYFGSKGFNWAVDGTKVFGVDFVGTITASGDSDFISLKTGTLRSRVDNATLVLQTRVFSAADNMIEMASGTTTFSGFDGEIAGVTIKPTAGILDAGDTLTVLQLAPVSTVDHTGGTLRGIAFGNITGDADAAEYMIDMQATGYDYLIYDDKFNVDNSGIVGVASADVSGTPIAATRATKTWSFTYAAGDDTDGVCDLSGGQADCFTIPDPTTHGKLTCFIKGTENLLCDYLIGSAGETVEVNDPLTKCSATDTCTDGAQDTICIYDAGSNAVVHNDMGQAETITCTLTYD